MVWDITLDDFSNKCGQGAFPLLKSATEVQGSVVMCYVPAWAEARPAGFMFMPEHVPPEYCTHVVWYYLTFTEEHRPRPLTQYDKGNHTMSLEMK